MGYVVLHLDKSPGNEAPMSAHIERTVIPPNCDPALTHLNKELVNFPDGVSNRNGAIENRLKTAGLTRRIGKNQVQVVRIMLTGSAEDMKRIESEGKLDDWCADNMKWLRETYGEKNIVSAVLHLDETTPHIHATMIPIVTGERRKAKVEQEKTAGKKKYRKKSSDAVRLCADDVMSRSKLKEYQDSYSQAMAKYGLQRGIDGSEARHINTSEWYRELFIKNESLKENLEQLVEQQEQAKQELDKVKSEVSKEKFRNSAADVGTSIMEGVGSLLGSSKTKRLQNEIDELKAENAELRTENNGIREHFGNEIKQLKTDLYTAQAKHTKITDKLRQELKKIYDLFPHIRELLKIENLCKYLGFSDELIKMILEKKPVGFKGKIYSSEFKRDFSTDYSVAEVKDSTTEQGKLNLTIDGVSETNWFRQKHNEFLKSIGINIQPKQDRGMKR